MTNQISFKAERKITQEDLAKKAKKRELFSNFGPLFGFVGMLTAVPMMATIKMIVDDYLEDGKIDGN